MKRKYRSDDSGIFSAFLLILLCCILFAFVFRSRLFPSQHAVWKMESPTDPSQIDTIAARIQKLETGIRFFSIDPKKAVWKSTNLTDSAK
jgi:hypothetical protein